MNLQPDRYRYSIEPGRMPFPEGPPGEASRALSQQCQEWIERVLADMSLRTPMAKWAAGALRHRPFDHQSFYDCLIDYTLSRMIDDDWCPDEEYAEEMGELLAQMREGDASIVSSPGDHTAPDASI